MDNATSVLEATPKRIALFWSKVDRRGPDECWPWLRASNENGYGVGGWRIGKWVNWRAHRIAYLLTFGVFPDELELDHLCRWRLCCNPGHLEPVTHAENVRRGLRGQRDYCPSGHAYAGGNVLLMKRGTLPPVRTCRICNRAAKKRSNDKARLARAA